MRDSDSIRRHLGSTSDRTGNQIRVWRETWFESPCFPLLPFAVAVDMEATIFEARGCGSTHRISRYLIAGADRFLHFVNQKQKKARITEYSQIVILSSSRSMTIEDVAVPSHDLPFSMVAECLDIWGRMLRRQTIFPEQIFRACFQMLIPHLKATPEEKEDARALVDRFADSLRTSFFDIEYEPAKTAWNLTELEKDGREFLFVVDGIKLVYRYTNAKELGYFDVTPEKLLS